MDEKSYVTKDELAEMLTTTKSEIIDAVSKLLKEQLSDSEATQDNYLEASGEN